MRAAPWLRFSVFVLLGALLVWAGFALWIGLAPLSILDVGQAQLVAKDILLRRCDPARVVVFGDSRAAVGIDAGTIKSPLLNLATWGANPVGDYYRLRTLLACPDKPDLVVLSYSLPEYVRLTDLGFWGNTVYSHMLPLSDRREIIATIAAANDRTIFRVLEGETRPIYPSLPYDLKNLLYEIYFPPFYGATALKSLENGIVLRAHQNNQWYHAIVDHGPIADLPVVAHANGPAKDAGLWSGTPDPVIDHYFEAMLSLLEDDGIASVVMLMPVNDATYDAMSATVRDGLLRYLRAMGRRYPHTMLADQDLPHWPDRFFRDELLHMNAAGAAQVSALLNDCLADQIRQPALSDGHRCSLLTPRSAVPVVRVFGPGG